MARKKGVDMGVTDKPASQSTSAIRDRDEFTSTMLERANAAFAFDTEQRRKVVEDMKFAFVPGNQWDTHLTSKRPNKPNYEFNRIRQSIRRVVGQQLKNKPQIKVRAVEDNDVEIADVYNGLIKNIEVQSSADNAYDTAMQWATGGGYGILRVVAEYEGDDTFDQCLRIKNMMDPMRAWCDPNAREFDRSDAKYWFIEEFIPRTEYAARWPKAPIADFQGGSLDRFDRDWYTKDDVRVAEYWYIEHETKTIHLLSDGTVVKAEEFDDIADEVAAGLPDENGQPTMQPVTIKQSREVDVPCVYSCLVSGAGKLEEPTKWGGTMIPIVPQWGDLISIDGKQIFSGMVRFGRDAQALHNFELSTMVEVVSKMPNSPLMATAKQIEGYESYYSRLGYDDPPVLLYNIDPAAPTATPTRQMPATFPAAQANISSISIDEVKATTGVYDASMGAKSNESSGRAILARQNEGEVSNYNYSDNQTKAIRRLGQILVDAIPHYYDTERSIRILGEDGAEKFIKINRPVRDEQTGETRIINDLSRGKFDVTVTVGKSFDTARMETAEAAQALAGQQGPFGQLASYMLLKSIDAPGMDEFQKAARKVLVGMQLLEPSEGEQAPPPPPPNPKDVADAEKSKADAAKIDAQTDGIRLDNAGKAAELKLFGIPADANGPIQPALPPPPADGAFPGPVPPPMPGNL